MKTNPVHYKIILIFIVFSITSFCNNFELHRDTPLNELEDLDINKINKFFNYDSQTKKIPPIFYRSDYYLRPYEDIKKKNFKSSQNDGLRLLTEHFLNFKIQKISEKRNFFLERLKKPYIIHHFRSLYNPYTDYEFPYTTSNYLKPFLRQSNFIADKNIYNYDDTAVEATYIGQQDNDLVTSEITGNGIIIHSQKESAVRNKTKIQKIRKSIIDLNKENDEFTYSFSELKIEFVDTRFAITPNDPHYNSSENSDINEETHKESKKIVNSREIFYVRVPKEDTPPNSEFFSYNSLVPENQKEFNNGPTQITSNYKIIDDIYFVSIVSGCSAAIMFAVVFMSLTWLRLQQGAKAAENIDYPAYGVTGPNKELLPSEDQRLAQSAQMYHFQHQKQQIIALEKNVRDPGSVSEVGSDEDNDEGDYTVYECPGLAPLLGPLQLDRYEFIDTIRKRRSQKAQNKCEWFRNKIEYTHSQQDDFDYLGIRWMQDGKFIDLVDPTWFQPGWYHPQGLLSAYDM